MTESLRVVVLGAGGVGGHFGGVLAQAGHEVTLLARGEHLAAIRARGLELRTQTEGTSQLVPLHATDDGNALPDADLVLVAVKSYSLRDVAPVAARLARGGATVVPLLNGVDAADRLVELDVPRSAIVGGLTFVSVARVAPGVIERYSAFHRITLGRFANAPDSAPNLERIVQAMRDATIDATLTPRIEVELWHKLVFIASMAAVCGLARGDIGKVRSAPLGDRLIERAVHEITAVAQAHGIAIDADIGARTLAMIGSVPSTIRPSFLLDLERGGATELDVLSGAISALGSRYGVRTPLHDTAVAALAR